VVFVAAVAAQYAFFRTLLDQPLKSRDVALMRPALGRWLKYVLIWQALVLAAAAGYVAVLASDHEPGFAWVAPAIAAVFGTALPLQLAVMRIMRAGRGA